MFERRVDVYDVFMVHAVDKNRLFNDACACDRASFFFVPSVYASGFGFIRRAGLRLGDVFLRANANGNVNIEIFLLSYFIYARQLE